MNNVLERARHLRDEMPRLIQPSQADLDRVRMLTEIETLQVEKKQARADALKEAAAVCRCEQVDAEATGDLTDIAYNHACDDC